MSLVLVLKILFSIQSHGRTRIGIIHSHVLVMQSLQNLQMVTRQQVEEFARRRIFPIGQAAVAGSEQSSSYIKYFSKFYLRGFP